MGDELGKLFAVCKALQEESPTRGRLAPGGWVPALGLQLPGSLPKLCHLCGSTSTSRSPPPCQENGFWDLLNQNLPCPFPAIFPSLPFHLNQDFGLQVTNHTYKEGELTFSVARPSDRKLHGLQTPLDCSLFLPLCPFEMAKTATSSSE